MISKQPYRLNNGGQIDRSAPISFTFDGRTFHGFAGDTLASALLANGVRTFGRSFKYHRPRGVIAAGVEEPNALIQLETGGYSTPNLPATTIELYPDLVAESQNRWPSLAFDVGAVNGLFARILPAGFYYKTFMWPRSFWEPVYERFIRKAAGLGKAPKENDPHVYAQRYYHCDLLIVGGGIAGLAAARIAARCGARVVLAEQDSCLGGASLFSGPAINIDGKPVATWVAETVAELEASENIDIWTRTTAAGLYDENYVTLLSREQDHLGPKADPARPRQRFTKLRAKQVILATGALERPLVFANNDRPGIMLASAIETYINRFGVLPGRQMAFFTNNDTGYGPALAAARAGSSVHMIDLRRQINPKLIEAAASAGITLYPGHAVIDSIGPVAGGSPIGSHGLTGITVAPYDLETGQVSSSRQKLTIDCLGVAGGWSPVVHLYSHARGRLEWDATQQFFKPAECPWPVTAVGAASGQFDLAKGISDSDAAARSCLRQLGLSIKRGQRVPKVEEEANTPFPLDMFAVDTLEAVYEIPAKSGQKAFHEFQNDSTAEDIRLAKREGFGAVEHFKRYTTTGMATDQGKTSNVAGLAVLAKATNQSIPDVGHTTFRQPYTPITFGAIAGPNVGPLFQQARETPMHSEHIADQCVFEDVGDWKRPRYFPRRNEDMHAAVQRESKAVRDGVGMVDATTLGKIDIQGPDSAWFLNMLYTNAWDGLKVGRCRYGLMLNEHGMIFDDGVTTRLADNHFHMTTTTGGAARVLGWMEEWLQTEWPERQVYCTSVTEQWAVASLNGPGARALLQPLTDIDLDAEKFPFMSLKEGHVADIPARVFRISFTGDLGYEINVPACYGLALWQKLKEAGKDHNLVIYGTETLHLLRAEKGYIIVGQDTDGAMTPVDIGMDKMISKKKEDFLGRRSLFRSDCIREDRKQLVGLLTQDPKLVLAEGAHLTNTNNAAPPVDMLGHVTSSYYSPNIDRSIALAVVKGGLARKGETIYAVLDNGQTAPVTISDTVFFDKEGARVNG